MYGTINKFAIEFKKWEDKKMVRPEQPEWFSIEEKRLAEEWLQSDSDLSIVDYILAHASKEFLEFYEEKRKMIEKLPVSKYPIFYNF